MRYFFLFIISVIAAAIVVEFAGDNLEESVRKVLYEIKGDSVPVYSKVIVDNKGVPYVDYAELKGYTAGKQYNATIVCNYAIDYYQHYTDSKDKDAYRKFFKCVEWLKSDLTYKDDAALFIFRWRQPWYDSVGVPFTSGMTSGLAIQVFINSFHLTKDSAYLELCRLLTNGYFIPVDAGGFTYKGADGWWYEELADTSMHTPFILDGHIFAVTGLHPYWQLTKNDSALIAINHGVKALKHWLPYYDIGNGKMYYDIYKTHADKHYQKLLVVQMKQLYKITGDEMFLAYHKKWKAPLEQPYVYRIVRQGNISGLVLFGVTMFIVFGLMILGKRAFR